MAPPSNPKPARKTKRKPTNLTITPPPQQQQQQGYRPHYADMPLYSPAQYHYPHMFQVSPHQSFFQHQSPNSIPNFAQTQFQTQSLADDTTFHPFDPPYQTQTNFQPRRLLDESTESSNEADESNPDITSEPELEPVPPPPLAEPDLTRTGKTKAMLWTPMEVKALGQAWLEVSEDDAIGNNQDTATWKERVWQGFCKRMKKVYRNKDQCYSKWRAVNKVTQNFNGVWMGINRKPLSGSSELDILNLAKRMYEAQYGESFKHEVFWEVVKDHDKWLALESADDFTGVKSKRSKTSSTTHSQSSDARTFVNIDLNDSEPYEDQVSQEHVGRDRAKAMKWKGKGVATSSSGGDATTETLSGFNCAITKLADAKQLKEKNRALKLLMTDESTVPENMRASLAKAKADIIKLYNWD